MRGDIEKWAYAYQLGDAAYENDWDRYWGIHKKMRTETWSCLRRIIFRIGAIVSFCRGKKWKI